MKNNEEVRVNGRRLNGEGSITKLKKYRDRTLYMGRIRVEINGKLKRISKYGKTKGEVRDKLREAKQLAKGDVDPNSKETVEQYLNRWYPTAKVKKKDGVVDPKPKTVQCRKYCVDKAVPFIGTIKLKDLRTRHINSMYEELGNIPDIEARSIRIIHETLTRAFNDATRGDSPLILRNPTKDSNRPSPKKKEVTILSREETDKLLSLNNQWTPLFTLLCDTGLRIGEALALRWNDLYLDEKEGTVKVSRTAYRVGNERDFVDPKTDSSRRTVPLTPEAVIALKTQLENLASRTLPRPDDYDPKSKITDFAKEKIKGEMESSDELIFPNAIGGQMDTSTALSALKRSLRNISSSIDPIKDKKAFVRWNFLKDNLRTHDLRHTCASLMIQNGAQDKAVQDILGHSEYSTTMNTYVHTNPKMLREAVNKTRAIESTG